MTLSKFSFDNKYWKLNEVSFGDFNLLVGQSGVGKTKILRALQRVCDCVVSHAVKASGCHWKLELDIGENVFRWEAEVGLNTPLFGDVFFSMEELSCNGREIISRNDNKNSFTFNGKSLPRLDKRQSGVSLLQYDPIIAPVYSSLSEFTFSTASDLESASWFAGETGIRVDELRNKCTSIHELRKMINIPLLLKAWLLMTEFRDEYKRLEDEFKQIFPTVKSVTVKAYSKGKLNLFNPLEALDLQIEEEGVGVVGSSEISAGMAKTFLLLAEIRLAYSGAVIVIDEIENSLGVNCLPHLMDCFLSRADLQFILTSHHPYVINNIPWKYWKLVTRKGSVVTVKNASEIPVLQSASSLEKFTRLLNLEEYEEAIR